MAVTRWSIGPDGYMIKDPEGKWVKHRDYNTLVGINKKTNMVLRGLLQQLKKIKE